MKIALPTWLVPSASTDRTEPEQTATVQTDRPALARPALGGALMRMIGQASVYGKRTVSSFCALATSDGDSLITFEGAYMSLIRIQGSAVVLDAHETEAKARILRNRLSGPLDGKGHALQFHFVSDPATAGDAIERCVEEARAIATRLDADFDDVFTEWLRIFPQTMRYEDCWVAVWSKKALLNRQEQKAARRAQKSTAADMPRLEEAQDPGLADPDLASRHASFVQQVSQAFSDIRVQTHILSPQETLKTIRSIMYPETRDDLWRAVMPPDEPPVRMPDTDTPADIDHLLWPPLREQIFPMEAQTDGYTIARFGILDWAPLDMTLAPDVTQGEAAPIVFGDLVRALAPRDVPWRATFLIEGEGEGFMRGKAFGLDFLNFWPNRHKTVAHKQVNEIRRFKTDTIVRLRGNFATCAPMGERSLLQLRVSRLQQGLNAWASCQSSRWCGDPVAGTLSAVPGLDTASTAPSHAPPLNDALSLMPWARPGLPWEKGSVLFRAPDGAAMPFDPGASGRPATLDLFVAPSRSGKSVAANRILLGTVLSAASATNDGYRFPLIAKLDIGESVSGFIDMVKAALPFDRQHLAAYYRMDFSPENAFNIFDLEVGCRAPLLAHRTFLSNFLSLICLPVGEGAKPYDRMDHLIEAIIDVVYDIVSDNPSATRAKVYRDGIDVTIDRWVEAHTVSDARGEPCLNTGDREIALNEKTLWLEIVDALCAAREWRLAGFAQRQASPEMHDLVAAADDQRIKTKFARVRPTGAQENITDIFCDYIGHFERKFPTIGVCTRLDLGDARIVALDVERICPKDQTDGAVRQTEMMYLLGFFMVSRKLTTDPQDALGMPDLVREYHRARFTEYRETYKRLEADEYHRTGQSENVRNMVQFVARESAKYRLSLGIASQAPEDFGSFLTENSTGRFIFGAASQKQADRIGDLFGLTTASRDIVRNRLNGPAKDGSGAPFLLQIKVNNIWYEQMLINQLGPIELWALTTDPVDRGLRTRLYESLGPAEARRRLARVFPKGTAVPEIDRRKNATGNATFDEEGTNIGAVVALAQEIRDCTGIAAVLRGSSDA